MRLRSVMLAAAFSVLSASVVAQTPAADPPPDSYKAEYVSGKAGFPKKIKGELRVGAAALTFLENNKVLFAIPMTDVVKATTEVQNNTGGMGRKIVFGNLSNRSEGFVYVNTETATVAEALVFKVDQKLPPGIAAKIEFAAKKAKEKK